jgi:putative ABC transport system ATP-binding protein
MFMLEMKDICKSYFTDTVETQALRKFNLTVNENDFISITGPSGAGKSTFLNIVGIYEIKQRLASPTSLI